MLGGPNEARSETDYAPAGRKSTKPIGRSRKPLARRFDLVEEIGWLKQELNLPVVQKTRFAEMRRRQNIHARELELNKGIVEKLFRLNSSRISRLHKDGKGKGERGHETGNVVRPDSWRQMGRLRRFPKYPRINREVRKKWRHACPPIHRSYSPGEARKLKARTWPRWAQGKAFPSFRAGIVLKILMNFGLYRDP